MTLFILAAGTSIPFGDFPKQLLDVGGETLLERQVRQFAPHSNKIYLVTHRTELNHARCVKFDPPSRRWKCDTLLSTRNLWEGAGRTIVIHGDVYFTDAACATVVQCLYPLAFFWNGGIEGTEAYALSFVSELHFVLGLAVLQVVEESRKNGSPPHDCGLMKLMALCDALGLRHEKIELKDGTRDFDRPDKHRAWHATMGFK